MSHLKKIVLLIGLMQFAAAAAVLPQGVPAHADGAELPDGAEVASVGGQTFTDFAAALGAWTEEEPLVLLADCETETIHVQEVRTLDLNGKTLSLAEDALGSVLDVSGTLTVEDTLTGGKITGGNASRGGGVYLDGTLYLNGGEISGNRAETNGGGIYVGGTLHLGGSASVKDNFCGEAANDLYLPDGKTISVSETYTGSAGILMQTRGVFAAGDKGAFTSDDLSFRAVCGEDGWRIELSPLAEIACTFGPPEETRVFPLTPLNPVSPEGASLKDWVQVAARNENGVPYAGTLNYSLSGKLVPGTSEVTVTAVGEGGETARGTFSVEVATPVLRSIEASLPEEPQQTVYFDTPLSDITFTLRGVYDDGFTRLICATGEETAIKNGEPYITDFYTLGGDLNDRTDGKATVVASVGDLHAEFRVAVSKHLLSAADLTVRDVTVVAREGAWNVPPERFLPDLPEGIEPVLTIGGEPFPERAPAPDVYTVEIAFRVEDVDNYEMTGTRTAQLTVNSEYYYVLDGDTVVCSFTREEGIAKGMRFTAEETEIPATLPLERGLDALQMEEITLFGGEQGSPFTVRLLLNEAARGKEDIRLFRVREDGSLEEIAFTREDDYLVFTGEEFLDTQFVVAADSGFTVYLVLAIVFGVACVAGATALFCYLVFKRKMMKLRSE